MNRYPYTYVKGLLGQARIAHCRGDDEASVAILQKALYYAGRRSLVREYIECVRTISELQPASAPVEQLQREALAQMQQTGLMLFDLSRRNGAGQRVRATPHS